MYKKKSFQIKEVGYLCHFAFYIWHFSEDILANVSGEYSLREVLDLLTNLPYIKFSMRKNKIQY